MSSKTGVVLLVVLCVLVLLGSSTFYTVDQREVALLMHFNKPVNKVLKPGLHVKWPIVSTVHRYDNRLRVLVTRAITYVDKDNKPIILQAYLVWQVVRPLPFYQNLRNRFYAEEKIREVASSALRISVSKYSIDELVSTDPRKVTLPEIERELEKKVREDLETLAPGAVRIARAGVHRLAFPADNEKAVYEEMISDRGVSKEDYVARGKQKAAEIMAAADREAQQIVAQAVAEAGKIRGQGEAEATEIYRRAYTLDRDFYAFWHALKTYEAIFGPETTLVLPADSELLKYFRMPSANPDAAPRTKEKK